MLFRLFGCILALTLAAQANAPLPTYWELKDKERVPYIDVGTISSIYFMRCQNTEDPNRARCIVEIKYAGVTYRSDAQKIQLPKVRLHGEYCDEKTECVKLAEGK